MKALAGRQKDYMDMKAIAKKVDKKALMKRFDQLHLKKGAQAELKEKLNKFIEGLT